MTDINIPTFYKENKRGMPLIIFIHGAGCDHTLWCYQNRYFYNRGYSILSIDLPGHGINSLKALKSIDGMANYINNLLKKLPQKEAYLIGHSMGSLICLKMALYKLSKIKKIIMIGVSYPMNVSDQLLEKSKTDQDGAIADMINWSLPSHIKLSGSKLTGINLPNLVNKIMTNTPSGVLFKDLIACKRFKLKDNDFQLINIPMNILAGENDIMTPIKGLHSLLNSVSNSNLIVLKNVGHFLTLEAPIEVNNKIEKILEITN